MNTKFLRKDLIKTCEEHGFNVLRGPSDWRIFYKADIFRKGAWLEYGGHMNSLIDLNTIGEDGFVIESKAKYIIPSKDEENKLNFKLVDSISEDNLNEEQLKMVYKFKAYEKLNDMEIENLEDLGRYLESFKVSVNKCRVLKKEIPMKLKMEKIREMF